jgi:hypothetical protein
MADVKAEPPGGGRQDHAAMQAGSMLPVDGPASTDTLAATGGLDVPGREPHSTTRRAREVDTSVAAPEPIPGAYERDTLTYREPGAIGGRFNGADAPPDNPDSIMDDSVREEHRLEGGGGSHERHTKTEDQRTRRR